MAARHGLASHVNDPVQQFCHAPVLIVVFLLSIDLAPVHLDQIIVRKSVSTPLAHTHAGP